MFKTQSVFYNSRICKTCLTIKILMNSNYHKMISTNQSLQKNTSNSINNSIVNKLYFNLRLNESEILYFLTNINNITLFNRVK